MHVAVYWFVNIALGQGEVLQMGRGCIQEKAGLSLENKQLLLNCFS